jgi:death-on-curing protein
MDTEFLQIGEIIAIHRDQISRYGGYPGIRDLGLLQSAIGAPRAGIDGDYFHANLFEMAAAYLYHIVQDHPFVDGNKRTGAAAAVVFLKLNNVRIQADPEGLERLVRRVAEGKADKASATEFFRELACMGRKPGSS